MVVIKDVKLLKIYNYFRNGELSIEQLLAEDAELKESDIKILKEWCQKGPHLPKIADNSLALFLHRNSYRIESTKVNMDHYFTLKIYIPEFFSDRDTLECKELRHIFNVVFYGPLQQLSRKNQNIMLIKLINTDASKFVFKDHVKYALMVLDLWIYYTGWYEHIVIFDVQDVSLGHAARVNPFTMKKYMYYVQEGLPIQIKELHFLHVSSGMEAILNISRPLMKKAFLDNVLFHTSIKTLEEFVSIEALPNELGGKAGPLKELHEVQMKNLEEHQKWFLEQELQNKVDETKRAGKQKRAEDFFGVKGSFKKLDTD